MATAPGLGGSSMTILGGALYAGGGSGYGFHAVDITDPRALVLVGRYSFPTWGMSQDLATHGGLLLSAGTEGLTVLWPQCGVAVGVGDPQSPDPLSGAAAGAVLSARPSPLRSVATIRFAGSMPGPVRVVAKVIDAGGRIVDEVPLYRDHGGFTGTWATDQRAGGIYFVTVSTPRGTWSNRIVVVN